MASDLVLSEHYSPFPKQKEFHNSTAKYRLFGGAAGPGKTKALLFEGILQALAFPGADTLLLRRTYPELESSLLSEFRRNVPRDLYAKYNDSKHIVTWHNRSTTRFGYCRNENDVYQYQGAEFLFIGLDELTLFTLRQWQFLSSRNRCPVKGSFPCMAGASNPGNVGHAWVKSLFVDRVAPAGFEKPELYDPSEYEFIPARLEDNPIYANDKNYRKTLEALPENLRRAFLEGDWTIFAGQYFDIFDVGRHVADPVDNGSFAAWNEEFAIQDWWPKWISIDWGFDHPSAVYWHTKRPDQKIITYREFLTKESGSLQPGLSPKALGEEIANRCGRNEKFTAIFLSPDAFADRTAEASIAVQLGSVFSAHGLPLPEHADNDRIGGWQLLYTLLETDGWVITANCKKLIECLPTLVRDDPPDQEDIHKVDGDDPADSARYGLVSAMRSAIFRKPLGVAVAERIEKAELGQGKAMDPTSRAIWSRKYESEERQKFAPIRARRFRGT